MYPALLEKMDSELDDLQNSVLTESLGLGRGLSVKIIEAVSEFMMEVNSYYTNAMEGNPSKLKDIEAALHEDFSSDPNARNYQLEHLAHIQVQKAMFKRLKEEPELEICSKAFLCWLHEQFYLRLPDGFRFATTVSGKKIPVIPGKLREKGVFVGRHDAPETVYEIERFLNEFERVFSLNLIEPKYRIMAFASSHHRLLWIHPFNDGNGRVARLFTIAYRYRLQLGEGFLWTVTRAFARNRSEYDRHLSLADQPLLHDYDGRGPLSQENLILFCKFFLRMCLDQIRYINGLLRLDEFQTRCRRYFRILMEEKRISKKAGKLMDQILREGEIPRSRVCGICAVQQRRATQIIKEVLDQGLAAASSAYGPLRLKINADLAGIVFPQIV